MASKGIHDAIKSGGTNRQVARAVYKKRPKSLPVTTLHSGKVATPSQLGGGTKGVFRFFLCMRAAVAVSPRVPIRQEYLSPL
jgi:hypothetical protein